MLLTILNYEKGSQLSNGSFCDPAVVDLTFGQLLSFFPQQRRHIAGCYLYRQRYGVNFTNILSANFTSPDPKRAYNTVKLLVFFALLEYVRVKTARKMLVKSTKGVHSLFNTSSSPNTEWYRPDMIRGWLFFSLFWPLLKCASSFEVT